MNKKFPVLVSAALALAPLSAAAQMHNQAGAKTTAGMPGAITGASLTNPGSMSMPLMPTAALNTEPAAPAPTVNAAMTPTAAASAIAPAAKTPVTVDSLYGDKEPVPPASLPYLTGKAAASPETIPFDGSEEKPVSDFSIQARSPYSQELEPVSPASQRYQYTGGSLHTAALKHPVSRKPLKDFLTSQNKELLESTFPVSWVDVEEIHGRHVLAVHYYLESGKAPAKSESKLKSDLLAAVPALNRFAGHLTFKPVLISAEKGQGILSVLARVGSEEAANWGHSSVVSYDMMEFSLKGAIARLEESLPGNNEFKTTVGADSVINLLKNDPGIKLWLKGSAGYMASALGELQKMGVLKAVIARTTKVTNVYGQARYYFDVFTTGGKVAHLNFVMTYNGNVPTQQAPAP